MLNAVLLVIGKIKDSLSMMRMLFLFKQYLLLIFQEFFYNVFWSFHLLAPIPPSSAHNFLFT